MFTANSATGTQHATKNYGLLYMAQGIGSLFDGPAAAWLHPYTDSRYPVFGIAITFDVLTAFLADFVLKRAACLAASSCAENGMSVVPPARPSADQLRNAAPVCTTLAEPSS